MSSFGSIQEGVAGKRGAEARSPEPVARGGRPTAPRKARARPITLLVAGAAALIAAVAFGTAVTIVNLRDMALTNSQRELRNITLVLAAQTDRIFEAAERVQIDLIERFEARGIASSEEFERSLSGHDVHLMLKDKIVGLPHIGTFTLFNADGKLFNFSRSWPIPSIDVADRDFFVAFKSDPRLVAFVSKPIRNRATGTWVVQLARKVSGRNGELIGLVTAAVELQSLEQFFASIALGPDSAISLLHRNGELLARHPHVEALVGQQFPNGIPGASASSVSPTIASSRCTASRTTRSWSARARPLPPRSPAGEPRRCSWPARPA
jgi:hypothetical protein